MYRQNSEKALLGGGGGAVAPPAPPPPLATLVVKNQKGVNAVERLNFRRELSS